MNTIKWLGLVAAVALPLISVRAQAPTPQAAAGPGVLESPPPAVAPVNLSPNAAEVVRLAESGVGESVILAFIHNTQTPFNLGAEDILYLKDVGVSSAVLTAMLNRDNELRSQAPAQAAPVFAPPEQVPPAPVQSAAVPVTAPPAEGPPPPAPVYVANPPQDVSYFYSDLAPYGSWVELPEYGWCWQPRVVIVNRGWRPYCDGGHWAFSDAGWYWQSDYSWGWAAFHYGRWHLHPSCGWVWYPDRVWGPAWVTWRSTGDYCGWAPLPPRATFDVHLGYGFNGVHVGLGFDFGLHADNFTFIALGDFHSHDFAHRCLPPVQVHNIYNHTTVINNYVVNNNVIVNRGLPVERVSAATHTQFQKMVIRDAPPGHNGGIAAQSPVHGVIYRPHLAEPSKPANMVAQKIDQRHPVVQHTAITPSQLNSRPLPRNATNPSLTPRTGQAPLSNPNARPIGQNQNAVPSHSLEKPQNTLPNTSSRNLGQNSNARQPLQQNQNPYLQKNYQPTPTTPATRSATEYKSEKGTYSSGQPATGVQPRTGQNSVNQNPRTYNPKSYNQNAEGRQVAPKEGKTPNSEPKKSLDR